MTSSEKRGRQSLLLSDCFSKSPVSSNFCFYFVKEVVFFTNLFPNQDIGLEIHWRRRLCERRADNPRYDRRRLAVGVSIAR